MASTKAEDGYVLMNRAANGSPWVARIQVFMCYVVMVACNIAATVRFERGATDGYAFSYVQPDGKTFGIWGAIYALLLLLCCSFLLNGLWLFMNGLAVINDWSYWSAAAILVMYAVFLWKSYISFQVEYWRAPILQIVALYAPLSLNLAWVTLAAILNISNTAMDETLDFTKRENKTAIGGPDWAMGVVTLATVLAVYLAFFNGDLIYGLGIIWAFQGIVRQQTPGSGFPHATSEQLQTFAQSATMIVAASTLISFFIMVSLKLMKNNVVVTNE